MYFNNAQIVLITIFTHRNSQNITPYRTLQALLPLEKSHLSQSLAQNERNRLVQKPSTNKYFSEIQITPKGIQMAKRYVSFLTKILNNY